MTSNTFLKLRSIRQIHRLQITGLFCFMMFPVISYAETAYLLTPVNFVKEKKSEWLNPERNAIKLPTVNHYHESDGGYISCYSCAPEYSFLTINMTDGHNHYLKGRIRLKGTFSNDHFIPAGYEGRNISLIDEFSTLCDDTFATCMEDCWAEGSEQDSPAFGERMIPTIEKYYSTLP